MLGPHAKEYEVWTLLSALTERTDNIDLGPLVGSITPRNPALLAKMATAVDILSEGRVRLGLGVGWRGVHTPRYTYARTYPEQFPHLWDGGCVFFDDDIDPYQLEKHLYGPENTETRAECKRLVDEFLVQMDDPLAVKGEPSG